MKVESWGRVIQQNHQIMILNTYNYQKQILSQPAIKKLAYGMAKSYGDVCLNPTGILVNTRQLDNFIKFDAKNGILVCQAGTLLKEIHEVIMPQGWMLPVTPGTQLITVGGAIANDIHGKNHHRYGTFGEHILELALIRTTGEMLTCSLTSNPDMFKATIGGIGLTGVITQATIQLKPIKSTFLTVENHAFKGMQEFEILSQNSEENWEYTVAWIDCLSGKHVKGIFMRANHLDDSSYLSSAKDGINHGSVPFTLPFSLFNKTSVQIFNQIYYLKNRQMKKTIQTFEQFQYPLDGILNWNRIYGKKGFYQYQCVLPQQYSVKAVEEILDILKVFKQGSFLVVLKKFSNRPAAGMLSFPMEGVTLALDLPNIGEKTLGLMHLLDQVVMGVAGRIYLAKDARMDSTFFMNSYPNFGYYSQFIDKGMSSHLSQRLMGF